MSSPRSSDSQSSHSADNGITTPSAPPHSPHHHTTAEIFLLDRLPHAPQRQVDLDARDAQKQLDIEKMDQESGTSTPMPESESGEAPRRVIGFAKNDPENPVNWHWKKKFLPVFAAMMSVMNSTISSSLAAGSTDQISEYFHITSQAQLVLPTSIFLVGYVIGPLFFGPLSESYGRKLIMIVAFAVFTIFTLACAVADTFAGLVVFRLLVGIPGSCAISVVGGVIADVYNDPTSRGRAMALFMAATTFGPLIGPVASGFIAVVSWRWTFWLGLIIAGVTWIPLLAMPETYGPVILKRRAKRLRKESGDDDVFAPIELEPQDVRHVVTVVLTRPIRMMLFEWIVLFSCTYGFNAGEEGLAFLPIGLGALIACAMYLTYDAFLARARARHRPWTRNEEARRLPLACAAGPFIVASLFWAGWTARPSIHWAAPVFAGVPFGVGYLLCFMAILNYLVDAYEVFAASAMAAAGTSRSVFGAVLPFATRPMELKERRERQEEKDRQDERDDGDVEKGVGRGD
ncbi:hypothetical protein SLS57_006427 [Botryosphaeria dothidea]